MSTNSTFEIREFVEQQHGGPAHLTGTNVVVMSLDVYREIMGVGTDAELQASLRGIRARVERRGSGQNATIPRGAERTRPEA